jgi:hypothetical protein
VTREDGAAIDSLLDDVDDASVEFVGEQLTPPSTHGSTTASVGSA